MRSMLSAAMIGKRSRGKKGEHARGTVPLRDPVGLVSEAVLADPASGKGGVGRLRLPAFDVFWGCKICPFTNVKA